MADITLKLTVGSFSVEVTGPQEFANEKFNDLVSQFLTASKPKVVEFTQDNALVVNELLPTGKKLSAAEFLTQRSAKNQTDQAMLLAYYLEKFQGQSNFTSTELGNLAREVKRPFANPSDVVAKLVSRGLMMSAGDKDNQRAYALTATGEEYVQSMSEARS